MKEEICGLCNGNYLILKDDWIEFGIYATFCINCREKLMPKKKKELDLNAKYEIVKYQSEDFERCSEIYEEIFICDTIGIKDEKLFDVTNEENELFILKLEGEIIGFAGIQSFGINEQYRFGYYEDVLNKFILDRIKENKLVKIITVYLTYQEEMDYFKKFNFVLYKDFATTTPEIYENNYGEQIARFALDMYI